LGVVRPFANRRPTTPEGVGLKSGALLVREWRGRLERVMILDDVYLEWLRLPQPFAGRQGDHRHELERTPLFRAEDDQERRFQQKKRRHVTTEPIA